MRSLSALFLSTLLVGTCSLVAQAPKPTWESIRLSDTLYELRADGGGYIVKVLASIGPDGVLLVDSGQRKAAQDLLQTIKGLGGTMPRIIINSHTHQEHVAGNLGIGKGPLYIGHARLRERLMQDFFLFAGYDEDTLPRLTLKDELTIHFNGEEIRIKAFPGAHDDCDIAIHFTKSKVAFVGALATACKFPSLDSEGDILKYPEVSQRLLDWLPQDTRLVPGHGEDATMAQGRQFLDMLKTTTAMVRAELARGKSPETLKKEDFLKEWAAWEVSYVKRNDWIDYLVAGLTRKVPTGPKKPTLYAPLHQALKGKGIKGLPGAYADLKANPSYEHDEAVLAEIGYILYSNDRFQEAIAFFELYLKESPKGSIAGTSHALMGASHHRLGDKTRAKACFLKALDIEPENRHAKRGLAKLEE